jgi:hypothetical protein
MTFEGGELGGYYIPAFQIQTGELVALDFPDCSGGDAGPVADALCARNKQVNIIAVTPPLTRSGIRELFHRQRVIEWFRDYTGLSHAESLPYLDRIGIAPQTIISVIAGNPRWRIAFQAALARGADLVVFETAGLDPLGVIRALQDVSEELEHIAAVYVNRPRIFEAPDIRYSKRIAVGPRRIVRAAG